MSYLFPYAGYDGPKRKPPTPKTAHKHQLRKATRALYRLEVAQELKPEQRAELEAAVKAEYVPPPSSGLPPSYRKILSEVAFKHKVPYKSILGISRLHHISQARREFMFRCMEEISTASYAGVGRYISRDHTTVLYAHKKGLEDPSSMEPLKQPKKIYPRTDARFSNFEVEVIRLTKMGLTHVQTANQLGKTPKQVTTALCEIRRKAIKLQCADIAPNFGRVLKSYCRGRVMTYDIVKRLRDTADIGVPDFTNSPIMREAADEIEKLRKQKHDISVALKNIRAENEKLRVALKPFADEEKYYDGYYWDETINITIKVDDLRAAKAALGESDE